MKFLIPISLLLAGCMTSPEPFVPYKTWTPPPDNQKAILRCIDMSNIYVPVSEDGYWWYGGNKISRIASNTRGWTLIEVGSDFPLPHQIWPDKVFWLPQSWQRKYINDSWSKNAFPVYE